METKKKLSTRQIAFAAIAIALATVIATFLKFKLPFWFSGGSITLFSMLIIALVGYWYGPVTGLIAAITYGILQFITGPYYVHPLQVALDFPLAFGALGLSGFFWKKKNGLIISGAIFYTEYVGNTKDNFLALWAGIVYNMSYIIPEVILTVLLLLMPPVKQAINYVTGLARGESH